MDGSEIKSLSLLDIGLVLASEHLHFLKHLQEVGLGWWGEGLFEAFESWKLLFVLLLWVILIDFFGQVKLLVFQSNQRHE